MGGRRGRDIDPKKLAFLIATPQPRRGAKTSVKGGTPALEESRSHPRGGETRNTGEGDNVPPLKLYLGRNRRKRRVEGRGKEGETFGDTLKLNLLNQGKREIEEEGREKKDPNITI